MTPSQLPPLEATILALQPLQKARRMYIKGQSRIDRAIESAIAAELGYSTKLPEKQRKAIMAKAMTYRKAMEASMASGTDPVNPGIDGVIFAAVQVFSNARRPLDLARKEVEDKMRAYAKLLPVWPWVRDSVAGLGELGLAIIVAESVTERGDHLGDFSSPRPLWKRLGLACIDGERQGRVPTGLSREDRAAAWIKRGYNPKRRAEVFAFVDDLVLRAQWRGARDANGKNPAVSKQPVAVEAHAVGPYGEAYGIRKAWNLARGLHPIHADHDARRFMAKRVIRDLWCAWQETKVQPLQLAA